MPLGLISGGFGAQVESQVEQKIDHMASCWQVGLEYNKLIADLAAEDELLSFIDIWDAMLSEEGERIPELFVEDGLHINAKGYEIWTKLVRENLKQRFNL